MFALVVVAQVVSFDVSGGVVEPLDDSMGLHRGWGAAVAARVTWPAFERIALGPRLMFDRTRVIAGNAPLTSSSILVGVAADAALGGGWTLSAGLAVGGTLRPERRYDAAPVGAVSVPSERLDMALTFGLAPHIGVGLVVGYEEYASSDPPRSINHFELGAIATATTEAIPDMAGVPLRFEVGAGAGYYYLESPCRPCDSAAAPAITIGITGRIAPRVRVGIDATLVGLTWYAGPVLVADVNADLAVRGSIGAGTWDGDDHDGGLIGGTGLSAAVGVDRNIVAHGWFSLAAFARAEVMTGHGVVPVVIGGLTFGFGH